MNGMQIWEVNGIDDLEGTCFAQCSTKEKAEKAMQILEENGFEDMLEVEFFSCCKFPQNLKSLHTKPSYKRNY